MKAFILELGRVNTDVMETLNLDCRERRERDLVPFLKKLAAGRTISELNAYEQ